jgi:hypothetical protein
MADTKISALTASTTPLAGTEVLPIVQSSTTKQVSVANLTAGRAVSALSATLSSLTSGRVVTVGTSGLLQDQSSFTFDGTNLSVDTTGNPVFKIRTSGAGNNPVYRLQFGSDYWDIQGTGSNAGKELYLIYSGNARGYFNSTTGAYVPVSDRNLKKNIVDISHGLSSIMALRPVEYNMKTESDDDQKHLGFIAQEAQEVIPSSVSEMLNDTLGMDKTEIIAVLVKAVQELKNEFDEYKANHS